MSDLSILILNKNEFINYKKEIDELYKENSIENGGVLISKDYITSADNVIIALLDNQLIGYMSLARFTDKSEMLLGITSDKPLDLTSSLEIKQFVVSQNFRGLKIGSKIFNFLKEYSRKNSIKTLYLFTASWNNSAQKFYNKQFFEKIGQWLGTPEKLKNEECYFLYEFLINYK